MIIKLVRHGQSETNAGLIAHGSKADYKVEITEKGVQQAGLAGKLIGADFFQHALVYRSPYTRTRQTCDTMLSAIAPDIEKVRRQKSLVIHEDPRLRELDHGYNNIEAQEIMRKTHGWFYYRFQGGESPADCYDRCCHFLASMMRQVGRKIGYNGANPNVLIVTHGLTLRCFVTRFMHMTVEQFESMANPLNCDIITIAPHAWFTGDAEATGRMVPGEPQYTSGKWGVTGLRYRPQETENSSLSNGAAQRI